MAKDSGKQAREAAQRVASQCLGGRLRSLTRTITRIYDEQLRPHGIKFSQMNILVQIALKGPITASQVAATLDFEKSTLSRNLKILEGNGWIRSYPGASGNSQLLETTALGNRLIREAGPAWARGQQQVVELFGEEAAEAIRDAFDRVWADRNAS